MLQLDPAEVVWTALNFLLLAALVIGLCFLQGWLSRRKSRGPGLVLPVFSWLFAIAALLNMTAGDAWLPLLILLFSTLAPPVAFTVVYIRNRRKRKRLDELKDTYIHDLE